MINGRVSAGQSVKRSVGVSGKRASPESCVEPSMRGGGDAHVGLVLICPMSVANVGPDRPHPVEPAAAAGSALAGAFPASGPDTSPPTCDRPLHRLQEVREQQGLALRRVAHLMGADSRDLRREELPTTDITLSRLYQWQQALDVPVADLLVESPSMSSPPVLARARLVRIMKTVTALKEKVANMGMRVLVETLEQQMLEIMPELSGVHPWQAVGQRRSQEELGRIAERPYSTEGWRDPS
jgi:transcriptional regulator with XRE-family HTH domain